MSNSIILNNILDSENSELKNAINNFMEDKVNEFKNIMKYNIEKLITEKLDLFYNKSFDHHDAILFDKDGNEIVKKLKDQLNERARMNPRDSTIKTQLQYIDKSGYPTDSKFIKSYKCFNISISQYNFGGGGYNTCGYSFFKYFVVIIRHPAGYDRPYNPEIYTYNLSNDLLFCIKNFQLDVEGGFKLKYLEEHPEYFKSNCSEFESICKKEYETINQQKEELQKLKNENTEKIDYYKSLELKIKDVEKQQLKIEEEKKAIKEEKSKMMIVKQKLSDMKLEIEKERKELEKEKTKNKIENVDIDKYFNEALVE
jgi:hypothetical protein